MKNKQNLGFHQLNVLQHRPLIIHLVKAKGPSHRIVIKANQPARACAPLRLTAQKDLHSRPSVRLNLKHLGPFWLI